MPYFEYNQTVKDVEYYEILENLMDRWEYLKKQKAAI